MKMKKWKTLDLQANEIKAWLKTARLEKEMGQPTSIKNRIKTCGKRGNTNRENTWRNSWYVDMMRSHTTLRDFARIATKGSSRGENLRRLGRKGRTSQSFTNAHTLWVRHTKTKCARSAATPRESPESGALSTVVSTPTESITEKAFARSVTERRNIDLRRKKSWGYQNRSK